MTFTQWYKETYAECWHGDYVGLYRFANEMADKYEEWCKENNQEPIWDS